jgi:hypothetical protein
MGRNKYGAVPTRVDGIKFASRTEARFYNYVKKLQAEEKIVSIGVQVPFQLLDPFTDKNGDHVRGIKYIADFDIVWADGTRWVVDTKGGVLTDVFKIKAKLFKFRYPDIEFRVMVYNARLGGWMTWDERQAARSQQEKNKGRKMRQRQQRREQKRR